MRRWFWLWMAVLAGCVVGKGTPTTPVSEATGTLAVWAAPTATRVPPTSTFTPNLPQPTETPSPWPSPSPTVASEPTFVPAGIPLPRLQAGRVTLLHLAMQTETEGWAVGTQGKTHHILRTQDGGLTWVDVSPPRGGTHGLYPATLFLDARQAWVAYPAEDPGRVREMAAVWWTQDGGASWQASPVPLTEEDGAFRPGPLVAADEAHFWLLVHLEGGMHHDYAALFASTDGGRSWRRVTDPWQEEAADLMTLYTNDLAFTPEGYGWATKINGVAPGGIVVETTDAGVHWRALQFTPPGVPEPESLCDTRDPHLWKPKEGVFLMSCYRGEERRSFLVRVSGREVTYTEMPEPMQAMQFLSAQVGWAWGPPEEARDVEGPPQAYLYRTTDGGQTWHLVRRVNWWAQFDFLNQERGWAIAQGATEQVLTLTYDGGRTWRMVRPQVTEP